MNADMKVLSDLELGQYMLRIMERDLGGKGGA